MVVEVEEEEVMVVVMVVVVVVVVAAAAATTAAAAAPPRPRRSRPRSPGPGVSRPLWHVAANVNRPRCHDRQLAVRVEAAGQGNSSLARATAP